jgi:hypothetical protein
MQQRLWNSLLRMTAWSRSLRAVLSLHCCLAPLLAQSMHRDSGKLSLNDDNRVTIAACGAFSQLQLLAGGRTLQPTQLAAAAALLNLAFVLNRVTSPRGAIHHWCSCWGLFLFSSRCSRGGQSTAEALLSARTCHHDLRQPVEFTAGASHVLALSSPGATKAICWCSCRVGLFT